MTKKDDREKATTFDCVKCGGTYSYKVQTFICPDCNIYCLLRPMGKPKWPYLINLPCDSCSGACSFCEEENRLINKLIGFLQLGCTCDEPIPTREFRTCNRCQKRIVESLEVED